MAQKVTTNEPCTVAWPIGHRNLLRNGRLPAHVR